MRKTYERKCGKCGNMWKCIGCEAGLRKNSCWCIDCLAKLGVKTKIDNIVMANSRCFTLKKEKVVFT